MIEQDTQCRPLTSIHAKVMHSYIYTCAHAPPTHTHEEKEGGKGGGRREERLKRESKADREGKDKALLITPIAFHCLVHYSLS